MTVGVLQLDLSIADAMSLKDKRRVVKSVKDRLSWRFNVSVAETGALDLHRRALISVAMVANESKFVLSTLSKIVNFVQKDPIAVLDDYQIDLL
jgi:uncharacterized protein